MLYRELLTYISDKLRDGGINPDDTDAEARIIAADIGEIPLTSLLSEPDKEVPNEKLIAINRVINIRIFDRKPLQYLVPEWEWYGNKFKIAPGVLCPRQETEMLINIIRSYWKEFGERPPVIADLCSGSGNIAITLKGLFPDGAIYAVENSPLAIPTFKTNCEINNADVNLITGSVLEAATTEKFRFSGGETRRADIIVCNPPYLTKIEMNTLQPELKHEPEAALYGGLDGLDFYRTIPVLWKEAIIPGGLLIFEIGADQARDVRRILTKAGFERITVQKDLSGNDRVVTAFVPA